jgi:cardiolipin synthase
MPDGTHLHGTHRRSAPIGALLTLPNAITFARLCAVPVAVWLALQHRLGATCVLFAAAAASDGLDGWLARLRDSRSQAGAVMDPVADKALLVSMFVVLAAIGVLPSWLTILVVFRDLLIVGGVLALTVLGHPFAIRPLFVSKINTALQLLLVATALLLAGFHLSAPWLLTALIWAVAASTLVSGFAYVRRAARAG